MQVKIRLTDSARKIDWSNDHKRETNCQKPVVNRFPVNPPRSVLLLQKHLDRMLKQLLLLTGLLGSVAAVAQPANQPEAAQWYANREWLGGLKARPADAINLEEFARQYHANKAAWDKAFAFLKNTDFTRLRPGKYPIDDENVYATIAESPAREFSNTRYEAHLKYIDVHFLVKGRELIGIAPVEQVKGQVNEAYNAEKDIAFYTSDSGRFHVNEPGMFYILTTKDAHNPNNQVAGSTGLKKVVVKVRSIP